MTNMETHLQEYLRAVDIVDGVCAESIHCEVCGAAESQVMVTEVDIGLERCARLPVVACTTCGYLYQNPRFNKKFYDTYYDKYYRLILFGDAQPERDFVLDQVRRGEHLLRSLEKFLPAQGNLLDVGCSVGGLMVAFAKRGWKVVGTDPDRAYVNYGRERLGLDVRPLPAEDMDLPPSHFDLTIITGSLEHVYDVNGVLRLCRSASKPGGLMLIEGRALNYGVQQGFFSHTHRRYLTTNSVELLMRKHGWQPILSTDEPLSGPTRPGGIYILGRACEPLSMDSIHQQIKHGARDSLDETRRKLCHLKGVNIGIDTN
jgi:SAM-dependent methyltransferase